MHNPKRLNLSTRKRTLPCVSLWTKLCSSDMSSLTISQLYNSLFSNGNEDTVHLKEQICYFKICIQRERANHPYVFYVQEFPKCALLEQADYLVPKIIQKSFSLSSDGPKLREGQKTFIQPATFPLHVQIVGTI